MFVACHFSLKISAERFAGHFMSFILSIFLRDQFLLIMENRKVLNVPSHCSKCRIYCLQQKVPNNFEEMQKN